MARPIEPTPILRGEAARDFLEKAKSPKPIKLPKLDVEEISRKVREILKQNAQS